MRCQAIRVESKKTRCSSVAVRRGLCAIHYVLAARILERHSILLKVISKMEGR